MRLLPRLDYRQFDPDRPPAVVLGGLDLVSALGLAAIPAIVATSDPRAPAALSRYCVGRCRLPPLAHREAVVRKLTALGEEMVAALGCRVPLFYADDETLRLVHEHRDALARHFLLLLNEPDLVRSLLDHDRFSALARARGLPVPRVLIWSAQGAAALARFEAPVIARPRVRLPRDALPIFEALAPPPAKARIFENGAEAMAHPAARRLRDHLVFEEYIAGPDASLWSFHGFSDQRGRLLAWFTGRKVRTHPALTGASAVIELARHEELPRIARDIAARMRLRGVFKINFKESALDGRLRVLGIDARFGLWHHVAARGGANLPRVAYEYLVHGERPGRQYFSTAWRRVNPGLDWQAFRERRARGEIGTLRWLGSLIACRRVYAPFSLTDPLPWLSQAGRRLRQWMRRMPPGLRGRIGRRQASADPPPADAPTPRLAEARGAPARRNRATA